MYVVDVLGSVGVPSTSPVNASYVTVLGKVGGINEYVNTPDPSDASTGIIDVVIAEYRVNTTSACCTVNVRGFG